MRRKILLTFCSLVFVTLFTTGLAFFVFNKPFEDSSAKVNILITFDGNGGTGEEITNVNGNITLSDASANSIYAGDLKVSIPVRTGFTFLGYYGGVFNNTQYFDSSGNYSYTDSFLSGGSILQKKINLIAKWSIKSGYYRLQVFRNIVGSNQLLTVYGTPGETVNLPTPPSWTGYKFLRWDYVALNSGGTINNTNNTYTFASKNVDLRGIWEELGHVTINYNDGSGTTKSFYGEKGSTYSDFPTLSRTGTTFKGWRLSRKTSDDTDIGSITAQAPYVYTFGSNEAVIDAIFTTKLTIDYNDGSTPQQIDHEVHTSTRLSVPTRPGYKFQGWVMDSGAGTGSLSTFGSLHEKSPDPFFTTSSNNVSTYNNTGNGNVSHRFITFDRNTDLANNLPSAKRVLQIDNKGSASPGLGGFTNHLQSAANKIFYAVIYAKIPVGHNLNVNCNPFGDNSQVKALTSNKGTGKYETYVFKWICGSTGSFNTINYFYLDGTPGTSSNPVRWWVAYFGTYEASSDNTADSGIDGVSYYTGDKNATVRALWVEDYWVYHATAPSGEGTEETPYLISSVEELAWVAKTCNEGDSFEGKYFKQTKDIDLNGKGWTPIGGPSRIFSGTYDGCNFKIHNFNVKRNQVFSEDFGLFGRVIEGTIKNVIIASGNIEIPAPYVELGCLIGAALVSNIIGCKNYANITAQNTVAGIVGASANTTIENCENYGNVTNTNSSGNIGGIVGWSTGMTIKNCINTGTITNSTESTGGIAGNLSISGGSNTVTNCINRGQIRGQQYVGGISGRAESSKIENCTNYGDVTGDNRTGGVNGSSLSLEINNCVNYGSISGNGNTGGITGWVFGSSGTITKCQNYGNITDTQTDVGGIIGRIYTDVPCTVSHCINEGNVSGVFVVGGIVGGSTSSKLNISYSYVSCNIKNTDSEVTGGGIIGHWMPGDKIDHSFFVGTSQGGVHPFYSTKWMNIGNWSKMSLTTCYSVMNTSKLYTQGDFSTFQVIQGVNQGYPVMQELFSIVQEPNGSAVLQFFTNNGFTLY